MGTPEVSVIDITRLCVLSPVSRPPIMINTPSFDARRGESDILTARVSMVVQEISERNGACKVETKENVTMVYFEMWWNDARGIRRG